MTRWIVFEGAPTVQEALDSLETPSDGRSWGEWSTSTFRLGFLPPEEERPGPAQDAQQGPAIAVAEQTRADPAGEEGDLNSSSDERVDQVAATPSEEGHLSDDPDPRHLPDEYGKQQTSHDDVLDTPSRSLLGRNVKEENDDSGFPFGADAEMLPPPAQKRRRSSRVQMDDATGRDDQLDPSDPTYSRFSTTYAEDDSYDCTSRSYAMETSAGGSGGGGIGGAPEFPFRKRDLVPLGEMHARQSTGQLVSVLACVWNMNHFDARGGGGPGKHEWSLLDSSGQNLPLIIWAGDYGDEARHVRLGDIVFIGPVSIDSWHQKLQLKYRRKVTKMHVCWRATLLDPEDRRRYRFHRDWAKEIPEAAALLNQVDYATARLT